MTFIVQQTLLYAVPLMIVALAGVFAERSGIINLALEGIMIFGAFVGVLFVRSVQGLPLFANAARSGDWLTLQGLELLAMLVAAALGAAIMAASAAGEGDIFEAARRMGADEYLQYQPDPAHQEKYEQLYSEYAQLHDYFGRGENKVMERLTMQRKI